MAALVSLEFGFEFMVELPCKDSACSCASSPCKKPIIPHDSCWKWDCVKCGGLDVEEADLNCRLHPLLIAIMPFGPLFPSSGDSLPVILVYHCQLRLWCQLWSLSKGSGICTWLSLPYLACPACAGEGSSSLILGLHLQPWILSSWVPQEMPWQSRDVPRIY